MRRIKVAMVVHAEKEGGYWASFPELPGCFTDGDTLDELRAHAEEAVTGWLEATHAEGRPLPETGVSIETVEVSLEDVA